MKKLILLAFFYLIACSNTAFALGVFSVSLSSKEIIQGEPVLIQVKGAKISEIKSLSFDGKKLDIFSYDSLPTSLVGIDLNKKPGKYEIDAVLKNGILASTTLVVNAREKYEAPLSVPESLGGNSAENQTKVVSELEKENIILASIFTGKKSFWTKPFIYPIKDPIIVTDPYGYSRITGQYTIAHKGVDLKAGIGTKVMAMNRGVVRVAKNFQVYGNTIIVDHGFGVMTFYMHLSKIYVNVGELVLPGQVIGLSGDTGYAEGPHLHVTVRINNISIDPIKFLDLFSAK